MKYYTSIFEKSKYFISGGLKIDNFKDLIAVLGKIRESDTENGALYRGQPEAKYKLYNSLQRLWIEKKMPADHNKFYKLVENLIGNCKSWNQGIIPKYLKYSGINENDISYLSIMQHYGLPTPLLDFTENIDKSLFFAIENIDHSPTSVEIENYFSVYYIFKNNTVLHVSDFFIEKIRESVKREKNLKLASQFSLVRIDNMDKDYRILNNLNIINQEGTFIFNSSPNEPLENQYIKEREVLHKIVKKANENTEIAKEIGGCLNINKKLVDEIRDYLDEKGINKDSIYPELNHLKSDCINNIWKNINA